MWTLAELVEEISFKVVIVLSIGIVTLNPKEDGINTNSSLVP